MYLVGFNMNIIFDILLAAATSLSENFWYISTVLFITVINNQSKQMNHYGIQ